MRLLCNMTPEKNNKIGRDLKRILFASSLSVLTLIGVMMFSPLASQFGDDGLSRGASNDWELDSLIQSKDYQSALTKVDSIIAVKNQNLPHFAYFDRFLSKKKRYDANVLRAQIYDLQWKRIEILQAKNDIAALKKALQDFSGIIGYKQEQAKVLLHQIKDK